MNDKIDFRTAEYWQNEHSTTLKQRSRAFLELARVHAALLASDKRCAELELANMMLEHRLNWLKAAETD